MRVYLFLVISILLFSCKTEESDSLNFIPQETIDYTEVNDQEIQDYLAANELTATKSDTGLYYIIEQQGSGDMPTANSNVTVAYKGFFTNGVVFDESNTEGVSFNLRGLIPGWAEGIPYFNEGGNGLLLVPSHLGYGSTIIPGIPVGSVLIFEIDLKTIN